MALLIKNYVKQICSCCFRGLGAPYLEQLLQRARQQARIRARALAQPGVRVT